jgi:hypothetical protein
VECRDVYPMATALPDLPRFLVLEPVSTVRLEIQLAGPACEIHVELENPEPGRSFVLLIGHKDGPYVQRVRLSGGARIHFDPQSPGEYVLLLANPNRTPLVLRMKAKDLGGPAKTRRGKGKKVGIRTTARPPHRRPSAPSRRRTSRSPSFSSDATSDSAP